jgi:hypothetical protein
MEIICALHAPSLAKPRKMISRKRISLQGNSLRRKPGCS